MGLVPHPAPRLNSIQSGYARPALAAGKNRFVLYNRSGNELRVESRTQNLYTKTMESSITLCAMADNGTLAVVTEDPGSAARLRVYSSSMEQLLSWSLTITTAPRCGWLFRRMGGGWQWRR